MADTIEQSTQRQPSAANMALFLSLFLTPAFLSYLSGPLLGTAILMGGNTAEYADGIRNLYLGLCYAVMLLACILRGRAVDRKWLVVFPIIGAFFDMLIPFPLVPTAMNIVVLAVGLQSRRVFQ